MAFPGGNVPLSWRPACTMARGMRHRQLSPATGIPFARARAARPVNSLAPVRSQNIPPTHSQDQQRLHLDRGEHQTMWEARPSPPPCATLPGPAPPQLSGCLGELSSTGKDLDPRTMASWLQRSLLVQAQALSLPLLQHPAGTQPAAVPHPPRPAPSTPLAHQLRARPMLPDKWRLWSRSDIHEDRPNRYGMFCRL